VDFDHIADVDAVPGEDAIPSGRLRRARQLDLLRYRPAGDDDPELHARRALGGSGGIPPRASAWRVLAVNASTCIRPW
jgi:hypothetical protein